MDGLPVVIRLLDPPLHEFLPNLEEQLAKVVRTEALGSGERPRTRGCSRRSDALHEQNPMLGLRGCRLGLMVPDFVKMQTRAILNAAIAVQRAGGRPIAKIMIPLVGHVNELERTRELLEAEAREVERRAGAKVEYTFGTMIEVPRGALTADEIARAADFFSFGTNDLTQMTFGYCRDAAERGFLLKYVEEKVLPANPFQTLDDAVADLMRIAVSQGPRDEAVAPARHLRRARRRSGVDRASASSSGSTTCRARRSACRSRASRPRRLRSRTELGFAADPSTPLVATHRRRQPSGPVDDHVQRQVRRDRGRGRLSGQRARDSGRHVEQEPSVRPPRRRNGCPRPRPAATAKRPNSRRGVPLVKTSPAVSTSTAIRSLFGATK